MLAAILTHVTWALAREWALSIRKAKTVTWELTQKWTLMAGVQSSELLEPDKPQLLQL